MEYALSTCFCGWNMEKVKVGGSIGDVVFRCQRRPAVRRALGVDEPTPSDSSEPDLGWLKTSVAPLFIRAEPPSAVSPLCIMATDINFYVLSIAEPRNPAQFSCLISQNGGKTKPTYSLPIGSSALFEKKLEL